MTSNERVRDLLFYKHPIFRPVHIATVAEACGLSYEKVLYFLSYHQNKGKDVNASIYRLVSHYRPDLVTTDEQQQLKAI